MPETRKVLIDRYEHDVIRHIPDEVAAKLHAQLDAVSTAFHKTHGPTDPSHAIHGHVCKFDDGIATARSCIDELARDHTLPKEN